MLSLSSSSQHSANADDSNTAKGPQLVIGEARAWLMTNGIDEDLATNISQLGCLDAIAEASEAQLMDKGLPKLKARRIHELVRLHLASAKVYKGSLLKKSKWLRIWEPRAFELSSNRELIYSKRNGRDLGRVSLAGAKVEPSKINRRELIVRSAADQVLELRAADTDERDTWVRLLKQAQISSEVALLPTSSALVSFPHALHGAVGSDTVQGVAPLASIDTRFSTPQGPEAVQSIVTPVQALSLAHNDLSCPGVEIQHAAANPGEHTGESVKVDLIDDAFKYIDEGAGLAEAAEARNQLIGMQIALNKVRLCVGDRVQVRNRDDELWQKGSVKELDEGRPKVQPDGRNKAFYWKQAQPLVSLELLASRVAMGHPARVREVLLVFEVSGNFTCQAQETRALLPAMACTFLSARLADTPPDLLLLVEAIIEAEVEGLSEQATAARAILTRLSLNYRFGASTLSYPEHIPRTEFADYEKFAFKTITARCNYELWKTNDGYKVHVLGAPPTEFLDDPEVLIEEKAHATRAEADDASWGEGLADMRIGCALRVDFLVALTFALNLWKWKTKEVVIYLVKPITEDMRCRFADHPLASKYKGKADALMSHAWDNEWGELVAAAAQGAPMHRYVWICALANRQWPGNKADIDFETMVERTNAIVVANPVPAGGISLKLSEKEVAARREALKLVIKRFTLSRIWCIVEMYIAMKRGKPIIFRSLVLTMKANGTVELSSEGVHNLMHNLSLIVDTKDAISSNPADTFEALIGAGMEDELNRAARAALSAAAFAAGEDVSVLDAYVLGEPELLEGVAESQINTLILNAVAFGYTLALGVLVKKAPCTDILAKAVYTAVDLGRKDALRLLLDVHSATNYCNKEQMTPLIISSKKGNTEYIEMLIDAGADLNAKDTNGFTSLHWAAMNDVKDVAIMLIDKGADIEAREDEDGFTSLLMAASKNSYNVAQVLVDKGADIEAKDENGFTSLLLAAMDNSKDIAIMLIDKGADMEAREEDGYTSLHWTAMENSMDVALVLVEKRANIEAKDNFGGTALHWAATNNSKEVAIMLMKKGANVEARDKYGHTPLHKAMRDSEDVARVLLEMGADIEAQDAYGNTSLHEASRTNSKDVALLLIEKGAKVNAKAKSGSTSLHEAALNKSKDVAQVLLDKGADIAAIDVNGYTSLHLAAMKNSEDVALLLLDKEADIEAKDSFGYTSLHWASKENSKDVVLLLLDKGADVNAKDKFSKTPLDLAKNKCRDEMVVLLESLGAKKGAEM